MLKVKQLDVDVSQPTFSLGDHWGLISIREIYIFSTTEEFGTTVYCRGLKWEFLSLVNPSGQYNSLSLQNEVSESGSVSRPWKSEGEFLEDLVWHCKISKG